MADATPTITQNVVSPENGNACAVFPGINPEELLKLVEVLEAALQLQSPNVTDRFAIHGDWLTRQFSPNRDAKFYIDPMSPRRTAEEFLSLEEVRSLLISIHNELRDNRRREIISLQSTAGAKLVKEYFDFFNPNEIVANRDRLKPEAKKLVEVVNAIVHDAEDDAEEIVEVADGTLPAWLTAGAPLEMYTSGLIQEIANGFHEAAPSEARAVLVRKTAISPIPLRKYLNQWLDRLYEQLPQGSLPARQYLEHTEFVVLKNLVDIPTVTNNYASSDDEVLKNWERELFPAIDNYLKQKSGGGGLGFTKKEEKTDKEETELTKDDETLENTRKKFEEAGISYRDEAARLSNEVLPMFFSLHGLGNSLDELRYGLTPDQLEQFALIERDFHDQLEYVFRHLSKEQIEKLDRAEGRLQVVRILFTRLAGRREFSERIRLLAAQRAILLVESADSDRKLTEQEKAEKERAFLKNVADRGANINKILESSEGQARIDTAFSKAKVDTERLASISAIVQGASKGDFEKIFAKILSGSAYDASATFEALDSYVAERFTPDRLRVISKEQFPSVFGFAVPKALLDESGQPTTAYWQFVGLCAEYIHLRRTRLTDHYQSDAVSHTVDVSTEDKKDFSKKELDGIKDTRTRAIPYRSNGGVEPIIIARLTNRNDVAKYNTHPYYDQIQKELAFLEQQRILREKSLERARRRAQATLNATSTYEDEDGLLENHGGLLAQVPIIQRYTNDDTVAESPFDDQLQFRRESAFSQSLSTAKRAFGKADSLIDSLEGRAAAASGVYGMAYQALPKPVRRGILGATVLFAANAISQLMVSGLARFGFFVGGGFGMALGPLVAIPAALLGSSIGYAIDSSLGLIGKPLVLPSLSGSSAPLASTLNPFAAKEALSVEKVLKGLEGLIPKMFTPASAPLWAIGGAAAFTAWNLSVTTGAFLPPLPTIGNDGEESLYVSIVKNAAPAVQGLKFDNPTDTPTKITYTISISPKATYSLTISDIKDEYSVVSNTEARKKTGLSESAPKPASPGISLSSLNGKTTLNPGDPPIEIAAYETLFDKNYSDSNVTNTVELTFTAKQNGTDVTDEKGSSTLTAQTSEVICFGECPQNQNGCWPASGVVTQQPFGVQDHASFGEDAWDIGNVTGTKIYAPFPGKACSASMELKKGFGNYVRISANDGKVFAFGHMSAFVDTIPFLGWNDCSYKPALDRMSQIEAGEIIGYMGSTGNSTGPHLHYQVGSDNSKPQNSIIRTLVPDGETAKDRTPVRSCYDTAETAKK